MPLIEEGFTFLTAALSLGLALPLFLASCHLRVLSNAAAVEEEEEELVLVLL